MLSKIDYFQNYNNNNNFKTLIYPRMKPSIYNGADIFLCTNSNPKIKSTALKKEISFSGVSSLLDYKYRSQLAKGINQLFPNLNCSMEDLQSIVGAQELKRVLKRAKPDNFSVGGAEHANVKNGTFTINLHAHTNDSDGQFTIEELLMSVAEYANKINKPVYIGITNHDTLQGLAEAVKLTVLNKEKFKNVRLVLGVEFNAKHEDPKNFSKPLQLEMIGYCINPFDDKLNYFFKNIKTKNVAYAQKIIEKVNAKYGTQIEFSQIKDYNSSLRNGGSPSFLQRLKECLSEKIQQTGQSTEYLEELFKIHSDKYGNLRIMETTPSMGEVITITDNALGLTGIAHPVRNKLGQKINFPTREEREANYYKILYDFIKEFKELGGKILEADYQYKPWDLRHPNKLKKRDFVKEVCRDLNLISSSGLDNHDKDIFH